MEHKSVILNLAQKSRQEEERQTAATITTADKVTVRVDDEVFDYYNMKRGVVITEPDATGWFDVRHTDGQREMLNGERICSLSWARKMGWLS